MMRTQSILRASTLSFAAAIALAGAVFSTPPAAAGDSAALAVDTPWIRANIEGRPSAAYMTIANPGDAADRLVSARSDAFARVELHTHEMTDGVMRMIKVEAIDVPAGGAASLAPGGDHVMLYDPTGALEVGATAPITLVFETAGEITVAAEIHALNSTGPEGAPKGHGHGHSHGAPKTQ